MNLRTHQKPIDFFIFGFESLINGSLFFGNGAKMSLTTKAWCWLYLGCHPNLPLFLTIKHNNSNMDNGISHQLGIWLLVITWTCNICKEYLHVSKYPKFTPSIKLNPRYGEGLLCVMVLSLPYVNVYNLPIVYITFGVGGNFIEKKTYTNHSCA